MEHRHRPPYVTIGWMMFCGMIYVSLLTSATPDNLAPVLAEHGVLLDGGAIWSGGYWTLLFVPLTHLNAMPVYFLPLLINMSVLFLLGSLIETALGRQAVFAVIFFGALISSGAQLALGELGLGFSGVNFALLGFVLGARPVVRLFRMVINLGAMYRILALVFVYTLMTQFGCFPGACTNVGHAAGLAFGWAAGQAFVTGQRRFLSIALIAMLIGLTVTSVVWLPWDGNWQFWRFRQELAGRDYAAARNRLERLTSREGKPGALASNGLAWVLATAYDDEARDGEQAIRLAFHAGRLTQWVEPSIIDTLAAAYAEADQWEKAEAVQLMAVKQAEELKRLGLYPSSQLLDLEGNLKKIQAGQKIRE